AGRPASALRAGNLLVSRRSWPEVSRTASPEPASRTGRPGRQLHASGRYDAGSPDGRWPSVAARIPVAGPRRVRRAQEFSLHQAGAVVSEFWQGFMVGTAAGIVGLIVLSALCATALLRSRWWADKAALDRFEQQQAQPPNGGRRTMLG